MRLRPLAVVRVQATAAMVVRVIAMAPVARVAMAAWATVLTVAAVLASAQRSRTAAPAWVTPRSAPSVKPWSMPSWP